MRQPQYAASADVGNSGGKSENATSSKHVSQ